MRKAKLLGLTLSLMFRHWANHFNFSYLHIVGNNYVYRILMNITRLINTMVFFNK